MKTSRSSNGEAHNLDSRLCFKCPAADDPPYTTRTTRISKNDPSSRSITTTVIPPLANRTGLKPRDLLKWQLVPESPSPCDMIAWYQKDDWASGKAGIGVHMTHTKFNEIKSNNILLATLTLRLFIFLTAYWRNMNDA